MTTYLFTLRCRHSLYQVTVAARAYSAAYDEARYRAAVACGWPLSEVVVWHSRVLPAAPAADADNRGGAACGE